MLLKIAPFDPTPNSKYSDTLYPKLDKQSRTGEDTFSNFGLSII